MKTVVAKFGGTSLADAGQFQKIKDIIEKDPSRRFIVASAPGKRFPEDIKVTDMLLRCYQNAKNGEDYEQDLNEIKTRFQDIMKALNIDFPIDKEIDIIRKHLSENPDNQYMASRGEYLNSQILASYLGFTFVDPAWCVCFNEDGTLDNAMTKRAMSAALRPLKNAVVAGFYGADTDGRIHTFSRGGSDVTGSLVASAIEADLYENWTDVSGLLAADPRIVDSPKSVEYLSYRDLLNPCKDELLEEIKTKLSPDYLGIKENLSMIAVVGERGTESSDANVKVLHALDEAGIEISTINQGAGKLNLLIGVPEERYKDAIRAVYSSIDSSLNEA